MAKTPDYTALARDYMNLMQQQMAGAMTHPQFIESMLGMLRNMDPRNPAHARPERHTPDAPATGDDALVRLERRVAKLERQLAKLHDAAKRVPAKAKDPVRAVGGRAAGTSPRSKAAATGTKAKAPAKKPRKR